MSKVCLIDSIHKTYIDKYNHQHWYRYKDGWVCSRCRNKLIANPKWHPITNSRRLKFKDKQVYIQSNPKTGYCSYCTNNIHNGSCKKTDIHHIQYHEDDPLKNTIELCVSCHNKIRREN